ncbi:hypothetical protein SAMN04487785_116115 [Dyella jiangningensis]|nr:hypothetical protein BDW41_1146 [Dyella sp. AtDHG13]SDL24666.1 hypothetical protein SAMN04487785_116115 [Dyella jiangningensis]
MRMVIDSNFLVPLPGQPSKLREYLARKATNFAVLPDFLFLEAYKTGSVAGVCRSMEVLCEFPRQVLVLKPTKVCSGLRGREAGLQRRMIAEEHTRQFLQYPRLLEQASAGDASAVRHILRDSKSPAEHMGGLADEAIGLGERIDEFANGFSREDRACIRKGQVPSAKGVAHMFERVVTQVTGTLRGHPNVGRWPKKEEVRNTLIFRACLCQVLLAMDLGAQGEQSGTRIEKMVNHQVDAFIAAYGTFFDGVFSNDKLLVKTYEAARIWLEVFRRAG